jgi:hypothetical protein
MNCDVCGKKISAETLFTCAEVADSRLCQSCLEAVTAVVAGGSAIPEAVEAKVLTNSPAADGHNCQSCGGSCDVAQTVCTACASELPKESEQSGRTTFAAYQPDPRPSFLSILGKIILWILAIAGLLLLAAFLICSGMLMTAKF